MDVNARSLKRLLAGPVQGIGLAAYFVLLPALIWVRWFHPGPHPGLLHTLLVVLALFWLAFLVSVVRALKGRQTEPVNGVAWLAGAVVSLLPFLHPSPSTPVAREVPVSHVATATQAPLAVLPALLATKRQRDAQRAGGAEDVVKDVDLEPLFAVHHFLSGAKAGLARVPDDIVGLPTLHDDDPVVVCRVKEEVGATTLAYARPGATLPLPHPLSANQLRRDLVGLPDERIVFADDEPALLRALATRGKRTTVVYTGSPSDLDEELRALCVCVAAGAPELPSGVSLSLLRPVPQVLGIEEPFVPTLRRRCVEMIAYLALHDDPVSGERLRARALINVDVEASKATLANTATAVRRSLGSDADGPRLHAVTAAGLYEVHGVETDVRQFHGLIATARRVGAQQGLDAMAEALALVQGEPLSSVTKGFDWFFLEGHLASIQRDGEWAAFALADAASQQGDYDLAFWALRQAMTLDPGNEVIRDALYATPRLREFGRDVAGGAQYETVSTRSAVAMSWALARFGH